MHVQGCGFRAAGVWLRDRWGEAVTLRAVEAQVAELAVLSQVHDLGQWLESVPEVVLAVPATPLELPWQPVFLGMIQERPLATSWNEDLQNRLRFSSISSHHPTTSSRSDLAR